MSLDVNVTPGSCLVGWASMSDDGDGSGSGSWLRFDQRGCRRRKTEDGRRTERRDVDEYRAEIYALINFSRHVSVRKIE
ncbi:hypothetical protein V9T40_011770 [Parthenolecanium corni]|uniref:Uncharacterized protein n=1 Tax=Parthenolecanium corni TaxID=536013 RepID=A0AAN9T7G0_9HEMI